MLMIYLSSLMVHFPVFAFCCQFLACSPRIRMSTINQSRPLSRAVWHARAVWRARAAVSQAAVQIVHRLLNSVKRYPKNVKKEQNKEEKKKNK